jgi:hypothetical protein
VLDTTALSNSFNDKRPCKLPHCNKPTLKYYTLVTSITVSWVDKLKYHCSGNEGAVGTGTDGLDEPLSREAADSLLDEEDGMETGTEDSVLRSEMTRASYPEPGPSSLGEKHETRNYTGGKRGRDASASTTDGPSRTEVPSLPPIYHTVGAR